MSYNGSGTFVINSTGTPVVTGTTISSTMFNALTADLATGLSTAICKDGQTTTTAAIPFAQGLTPSQTIGIIGTTTNNSANGGSVGEILTASVASGAAAPMTTNTETNIVSKALSAGDWEVTGLMWFTGGATTNTTYQEASISATSATQGTADALVAWGYPGGSVLYATTDNAFTLPTIRLSLSTTTTIYIVAKALFTVSTTGGYGTIKARRVR